MEKIAKENLIESLADSPIEKRREIVNKLLNIIDDEEDDDFQEESRIVMEEYSRFQRLLSSGKKLFDEKEVEIWTENQISRESLIKKTKTSTKSKSSLTISSSSTSNSYKVQTSIFNFFSPKKN